MSPQRQTLPSVAPDTERRLPETVKPMQWEDDVRRAEQLAAVLDRHLDYEAKGRLMLDPEEFRPIHLCPEQRVECITDMYALSRD